MKAYTDLEQSKDLPIFDGFDYLGNQTGIKCMVCLYQHIKCKYQGFFGEGAFLICKKYKEHPWCAAVIKDFNGDVEFVVKDNSLHIIGTGNKLFFTVQSGL